MHLIFGSNEDEPGTDLDDLLLISIVGSSILLGLGVIYLILSSYLANIKKWIEGLLKKIFWGILITDFFKAYLRLAFNTTGKALYMLFGDIFREKDPDDVVENDEDQ
jgi:hypothetical protein